MFTTRYTTLTTSIPCFTTIITFSATGDSYCATSITTISKGIPLFTTAGKSYCRVSLRIHLLYYCITVYV